LKVGISLPQAGIQATKENMLQTAQTAEREGFDSIWTFERLLWPINPQTPILQPQMEVFLKNII